MRIGPDLSTRIRAARRTVLALASCLLAMSAGPARAAHNPDYVAKVGGPYRLLFEVDSTDPAAWNMTMGAVKNIIRTIGTPPARLEVLVWGPGLRRLFRDGSDAVEISALDLEGVRFVACGRSMVNLHIKASQLADGVTVVPGGMAELVKRHNDGWAEVKM
jgi:intracellular sulfur oxidation DsrE/DsrF family protein